MYSCCSAVCLDAKHFSWPVLTTVLATVELVEHAAVAHPRKIRCTQPFEVANTCSNLLDMQIPRRQWSVDIVVNSWNIAGITLAICLLSALLHAIKAVTITQSFTTSFTVIV